MVLKMTKKNKEKVIYLVTYAGKKAPLINLYSLPTKCPVCHLSQEPQSIGVHYKDNDDARVEFRCGDDKCKSSFSALYFKGRYGNEQYHLLCFI